MSKVELLGDLNSRQRLRKGSQAPRPALQRPKAAQGPLKQTHSHRHQSVYETQTVLVAVSKTELTANNIVVGFKDSSKKKKKNRDPC